MASLHLLIGASSQGIKDTFRLNRKHTDNNYPFDSLYAEDAAV